MSLLFDALPTGAGEVLTDASGVPFFKRVDLGRFLKIANVRKTYQNLITTPRNLLCIEVGSNYPSQRQNDDDAFVSLDTALKIVVLESQKQPSGLLAKILLRLSTNTKKPSTQSDTKFKKKTLKSRYSVTI